MMDYEVFKEMVKSKFMDYLPEQYREMQLEINRVDKVNCTLDGINLIVRGAGKNVSPTIYINDLYEHYKRCGDIQEVLRAASESMVKAFEEGIASIKLDYSRAKENIVFQLVNTEQNQEMLAGMPHREYQDLSIIYRWVVVVDEESVQSTAVKNAFAEQLGLTEEQLFDLAAENTKRLFPPIVMSMSEVMREMLVKDGMPQWIAEVLADGMSEEPMMYVITNDRRVHGAASMLYEDELYRLSAKLEDDLYILPSSIHEVIAVTASSGTPEELANIVLEVNMSTVSLGERLSNQVYYYDRDLRKVSLATNTSNKRLDDVMM